MKVKRNNFALIYKIFTDASCWRPSFDNRQKSDPLPFTPKSEWTPRMIQLPPGIRKLIRANLYALRSINWNVRDTLNLLASEVRALKQLKVNKNIVIKPAGKGSAVVILYKT